MLVSAVSLFLARSFATFTHSVLLFRKAYRGFRFSFLSLLVSFFFLRGYLPFFLVCSWYFFSPFSLALFIAQLNTTRAGCFLFPSDFVIYGSDSRFHTARSPGCPIGFAVVMCSGRSSAGPLVVLPVCWRSWTIILNPTGYKMLQEVSAVHSTDAPCLFFLAVAQARCVLF